MIHFLNGKFVEEAELVISVRDLGFARGYAVFDFLVTYNERPFMLAEHIDRLFNSAALIELSLPWPKEQITDWVMATLEKNKDGGEKMIKITISGGVSSSLLPSDNPTIAIIVDERSLPPAEYYQKGVALITAKHMRYTPEAKTNNYIEGIKQIQRAKKVGALEPIYYNDTQVFETTISNIFAVIDGKLITPASNVLHGITRGVLLDILKLDIPVEAADFSLEELLGASEIFATGSNKGVVPVTLIDGKPVGDGQVGPVTKEVMRQYDDFAQSDRW